MKRHYFAAPVLAVGIALGSLSPAFAADSTTTTPTKQLSAQQKARLNVACARIPNLITRTENLQKRLPADASTKGSIAWVEKKAADATAKGRVDVATVLTNRATVMKAKQGTLATQLTNLHKAQDSCTQHGYTA
jgi:hypothetical protein